MLKVLIGFFALCLIVLFGFLANMAYDEHVREEQIMKNNLAFLDSLTVIMNKQARLQEVTLQKQDSILTDLRTMNTR